MDMTPTAQLLAHAISGLGVIAIAFVGRRRRLGWLLSATGQACLVVLGVYFGLLGFIIWPPIIIAIQMHHMWIWRREGWRKLDPNHVCRCRPLDDHAKDAEELFV